MNETYSAGVNETVFNATEVASITFGTWMIITLTILVNLIAVISNALVIIFVIAYKILQTFTNYLFLSLAVADFMSSLISMPLFTTYFLMKEWTLGPLVCDVWLSLTYLFSFACMLSLVLMALDLYLTIVNPFQYRARRNGRLAGDFIACTWLLSLSIWPPCIMAFPYLMGKRTVPDNKCYIPFLEVDSNLTFLAAFDTYYLPAIVMCVLFYKIWLGIKQSAEEQSFTCNIRIPTNKHVESHFSCPSCDLTSATDEKICIPCFMSKGAFYKMKVIVEDFSKEKIKECVRELKKVLSTRFCTDQDDTDTKTCVVDSLLQASIQTFAPMLPKNVKDLEVHRIEINEYVYTIIRKDGFNVIQVVPPNEKNKIGKKVPGNTELTSISVRSPRRTVNSVNKSTQTPSSGTLQSTRRRRKQDILQLSVVKMISRNKILSYVNATKTLFFLFLSFIYTRMPYSILLLMKSVGSVQSSEDIQFSLFFSYFLCYMNSMVNPICYALMSPDFNKVIRKKLT